MRRGKLPFWLVFPAVTMSLGWGLRGSIGGGPLGAMIPGAMVGLALCLLLGRERDAGRIAAMAAVGVGFGGQETYGQTVGLSLQPETFRWAMLGFALKGAAWGLLGGAAIGIALDRVEARRATIGFALMALGTWIGWQAIDHPKLMYFSNRLDRPREELWAGLWLGGLLMLAWLRARLPSRFALWGAIGGGVGFALGASLQPWGRAVWPAMPLGWWKAMELTFGALLGAAYGWCAWRTRADVPEWKEAAPGAPLWTIGYALAAIALTGVAEELLPVRFGYTLGGAALLALAMRSEAMAWQTAITATVAFFAADVARSQKAAPAAAWALAAAATVLVAVAVWRRASPRAMFLLLTWTAIAASFRHVTEAAIMVAAFVLLGIPVSAMSRRLERLAV
jgi:hypothetical protein